MAHVLVGFARRNLASSTRAWRAERSGDSWATRAAGEGVRSRAAYKLEEINTRFGKFLRPGVNVVDLGAAPGGFSVIATKLVKPRMKTSTDTGMDIGIGRADWKIYPVSDYDEFYDIGNDGHDDQQRRGTHHQKRRPYGRVVCVDLEEMDEIPGAVFVHGDANDSLREIRKGLNGEEADVIISDMAPKTSTDPLVSHVKSINLARNALNISEHLLRNGGTFVVKVFMGEDEKILRQEIEARFVDVQAYKPKACRKNSREHYIVAKRFVKKNSRIEPHELDIGEHFHTIKLTKKN